jgi:hypothetical protein
MLRQRRANVAVGVENARMTNLELRDNLGGRRAAG